MITAVRAPQLISADDLRLAVSLQRLRELTGRLEEESATQFARLRQAVFAGQRVEGDRLYQQVREQRHLCQELRAIGDEMQPSGQEDDIHVVSTHTLIAASSLCRTEDGHENIAWAGGIRLHRYLLPQQLRLLPLASSSRVHASADPKDIARIAEEFETTGSIMVLHFHRHPRSGPDGTVPSETDLVSQETMERGGYPAVGAIFSQDGYLRFYAKGTPFTIHLIGKGVTNVGTNLFQLHTG